MSQRTLRDLIELEISLSGDCNVRSFAARLEKAISDHISAVCIVHRMGADLRASVAIRDLEASLTYSRPRLRNRGPEDAA
jgi:hypothetical protein